MSRGYPDYFGSSIWPKFGTALCVEEDINVVPSMEELTVLTISQGGVLFCMRVGISEPEGLDTSDVILKVDGEIMDEARMDPDIVISGLGGGSALMSVVFYDAASGDATIMLSREVPFHDKIEVVVYNTGTADMDVTVKATHYVVV